MSLTTLRPLCCLGLLAAAGLSTVVQAQTARAASVAAVTAVDVTSDPGVSEAMQRALRQAAGPMRVILEAGRASNRRAAVGASSGAGAEAPTAAPASRLLLATAGVAAVSPSLESNEPVAAARSSAPTATVAASPVLAPGTALGVAAGAATGGATGVATGSAPVAAVPAAAATVSATARAGDAQSGAQAGAEPIVAEITLSSGLTRSTLAVDGVPALALPAAAPVEAAAVMPSLPILPELAWTGPRLVSMVEPAVPPRWMQEAMRLHSVPVELTLRRDGTVAAAAVPLSVSRNLARVLQQALEQWRFEPVPMEVRHRVELVFNPEP